MSALTDVLEAHRFRFDWDSAVHGCSCGQWIDSGPGEQRVRRNYEDHLADAIAADARLAVIELPERRLNVANPSWRVALDGEPEDVWIGKTGGITVSGHATFDERDVPDLAAALLAAADAAEASS